MLFFIILGGGIRLHGVKSAVCADPRGFVPQGRHRRWLHRLPLHTKYRHHRYRIWHHSQEVRQGSAKFSPPVQVWVMPPEKMSSKLLGIFLLNKSVSRICEVHCVSEVRRWQVKFAMQVNMNRKTVLLRFTIFFLRVTIFQELTLPEWRNRQTNERCSSRRLRKDRHAYIANGRQFNMPEWRNRQTQGT